MENYMIFLMKMCISLWILYAVYWFVLRKETFFKFNRIYLIGAVCLSMLIPLFNILGFRTQSLESINYILNPITITQTQLIYQYSEQFSFKSIVLIVYLCGILFFAIRFILRFSRLIILIKRFGITKISGVNYVFTDEKYAPFSFFNLVFINKSISSFDAEKIVAHEQIHVKQFHSLDILFFELLVVFQWFNPIVWLYKQSIKEVHEFLADKGVLTKGYEKKGYQQLLLALCMRINVTDLTNNFNTSQIKRRFIMMTKMKSGLIAKVKFMVVVPIIVITMVFIACNDTESKKPENSKSTTDSVKEQTQAVQAKADEPIFNEVEEMPVFGKTNNDLSNYLASNIKYPKAAMEKGIQGKVFVSFVVTKTGAVANVKVEKPVNELLDAEAVRVVSAMPKWTPGMDKRNPVNVKLTLPINFKLK